MLPHNICIIRIIKGFLQISRVDAYLRINSMDELNYPKEDALDYENKSVPKYLKEYL